MQSPILEVQDGKGRTLIKQDIYSLVVVLALKTGMSFSRVLLDGQEVECPPEAKDDS